MVTGNTTGLGTAQTTLTVHQTLASSPETQGKQLLWNAKGPFGKPAEIVCFLSRQVLLDPQNPVLGKAPEEWVSPVGKIDQPDTNKTKDGEEVLKAF